jgi:hypothetical protein
MVDDKLDEATRERLGRIVRHEWVKWALEQADPKPHWLSPWEDLDEPMKEVDRRIGERIYLLGRERASDWLGPNSDGVT